MESETIVATQIIDWAASRLDGVVFNPKEGYYAFDIIVDAFDKGKEEREKEMKIKVRERFYSNAKLVAEALNVLVGKLKEKEFQPQRLFLKHSYKESLLLLSIPEEIHYTDNFIDYAYVLTSQIQAEYKAKGLNFDVSFVDESIDLNTKLIESDGYEFLFDFVN